MTEECKVVFVKHTYNPKSNSYWSGVVVRFTGWNGAYFYECMKKKLVDWEIFDLNSTNLGRFDLMLLRDLEYDRDHTQDLELFMEKSCKKVKPIWPKKGAKWKPNKKGLLLQIGNRDSHNFIRVYEKSTFLEFELEIKKDTLKSFQDLVFSDRCEEFEDKLSKHFYRQQRKNLALDSCYTDWLLIRMRNHFPKENNQTSLVSSYLDSEKSVFNSFIQKERFFKIYRI